MKEKVLHLTKAIPAAYIEQLCTDAGLTITMKGSLKSLPANTHWHYKSGKEPGVLEITLMLIKPEVIFSYKDNRRGEWIDGAIGTISQALDE